MILELKQCNDSKKLNQPVLITPESSTYNRILLLFPSPVINIIFVCHSVSLSTYSILIDSVFHSRWLPYVLFLLAHTTAFHQSTSSCQKRPYCTCNYMLVNLPASLLGHLSATAVSNCYHSPSDCIGHATSIADTSISIMASAVQFICLSLLLSLCFHYADAECVLFSWLLVSSSSSPSPPKNHALLITGHYCC